MDKEASRLTAGYREDDMIYETARQRVRLVIAWYDAQIQREGYAARLDCARIAQLEGGRRRARSDRRLLDRTDDPGRIRALYDTYGALFLQLKDEEAPDDEQ